MTTDPVTLTDSVIVDDEDGAVFYLHGVSRGDHVEPAPSIDDARAQVADAIVSAHFYSMVLRSGERVFFVPDGQMEHEAETVEEAAEILRRVLAELWP